MKKSQTCKVQSPVLLWLPCFGSFGPSALATPKWFHTQEQPKANLQLGPTEKASACDWPSLSHDGQQSKHLPLFSEFWIENNLAILILL